MSEKISLKSIKAYYKDPKNQSVVDVGLFVVLIISFHYLYLGWQALDYWPIKGTIDKLMLWAVDMAYNQSCWLLENVFHLDLTTVSDIRYISTPNNEGGWARAIIAPECASLKQWLHWLFLMIIFPGPWKHKLWYIPAGLVVVEWTNVVRICGVIMMQIPWPNSFHIAHDYIFKVFFYLIIFLMWVLWVECFKNKQKDKVKTQNIASQNDKDNSTTQQP